MDGSVAQNKPKYQSLDAGRGIAAVAVVWHHSTGMLQVKDLWANPWYLLRFYGFALGVAYFFVLSGTVILLAHWRDVGRPEATPSYLWKRAKRIYPIYWIALVMGMVLYRHPLEPVHVYFDNFLLVRTMGPAIPILVVAWTLFHEVFFYLAFLAVILHKRLGWLVLCAWWVLAAARYQSGPVDQGAIISSVQLLFALGLLAAYLIRTRRIAFPGALLGIGSLITLLTIIWCGYMGQTTMPAYLICGLGAFLMIIGAAELESGGRLRVPKALLFLGRASYSIYLFHLVAAIRLGRTFFRLNRHVPLPQPAWLVLIFLGSVAFGCLMHVYVEQPLMSQIAQYSRRPARA